MKITALENIRKTNNPYTADYNFTDLARFITYRRRKAEKKNLPCWSPAEFDGEGVKSQHVKHVTCAVYDIDEGTKFDDHILFKEYQYIAHTSYSHTVKNNKWRLIIPLAQPVEKKLWPYAWKQLNALFKKITSAAADAACKDARRFYYLPCENQVWDCYINNEGKTINIDIKKCNEQYKKDLEKQKRHIEKQKKRAQNIANLPHYMIDVKEEISLKLAYDTQYRLEFANKIGGINTYTNPQRIEKWICPECGRNDATYYYVNPLGNSTWARCGHLDTHKDGTGRWTLYQLGKLKGVI